MEEFVLRLEENRAETKRIQVGSLSIYSHSSQGACVRSHPTSSGIVQVRVRVASPSKPLHRDHFIYHIHHLALTKTLQTTQPFKPPTNDLIRTTWTRASASSWRGTYPASCGPRTAS